MKAREIIFREATAQDAATFLDFMAQVARESDYLVMDEEGLPHSQEQMAAELERSFVAPDQLTLVAAAADELLGVISVRTRAQQKINHIGNIFIAVKKSYWGQGIGRILLEEMLDWATQEGVLARLELTVQVRNQAAVHLYQDLGFEIEGTQKRGAKSNEGEWLDLYYMGQLIN